MTAPIHTPTKPFDIGAARSGSQRDRRWTDTFFDSYRHPSKFPNGRPFTGEREYKSGSPEPSESAGFITPDLQCGQYFCDNPQMGQTREERQMTLASAWSAPWLPLAKYWRFNNRAKRITFALDKMISDQREALARFWTAAAKMAGDGEVVNPETNQVSFRIRTVLAQSPLDFLNQIKLANAMLAGDPWLMGFVEEPNDELARIVGIDVKYVGGHASDREYVAGPKREPIEREPIVSVDQVLATPASEITKMVAEAVAAAMAVRDQQEAEKKERARQNGKKGAAKRAANRQSPPLDPAA